MSESALHVFSVDFFNTTSARKFPSYCQSDEDIPTVTMSSTSPSSPSVYEAPQGLMTRTSAKLLNKQVNLFRNALPSIDEDNILPYASFLYILRFEQLESFGTEREVRVDRPKAWEEHKPMADQTNPIHQAESQPKAMHREEINSACLPK